MQRYKITEQDIVKEKANLNYPVGIFVNNLQKYINKEIVSIVNIPLEPSLELVVNNGTYLTLNDEIILKPICKILNVEYKEIERNDKLHYYYTLFASKKSELKMIKSEEELFVKFPYIHELYMKRKKQITEALDVYSLTNRVLPIESANSTKKRLLLQYRMDEELCGQLLNEAMFFNLSYFIERLQFDLTNLVNSLAMLMGNISSFIVDVNSLPSIDKNKVSSIVTPVVKLKR